MNFSSQETQLSNATAVKMNVFLMVRQHNLLLKRDKVYHTEKKGEKKAERLSTQQIPEHSSSLLLSNIHFGHRILD